MLFTLKELYKAITPPEKGKATDARGVSEEMTKHSSTRAQKTCYVCTAKSSSQARNPFRTGMEPSSPSSYRPICSLLILYRFFSQLLFRRSQPTERLPPTRPQTRLLHARLTFCTHSSSSDKGASGSCHQTVSSNTSANPSPSKNAVPVEVDHFIQIRVGNLHEPQAGVYVIKMPTERQTLILVADDEPQDQESELDSDLPIVQRWTTSPRSLHVCGDRACF